MALSVHLIFLLYSVSCACGQNCEPYEPSLFYRIPQFGSRCQYRCRCINDEQCDKPTGHCLNGCALGWMGPGCQYRNIVPFNDGTELNNANGSVPSLAIDGNNSTCSYISGEQGSWWRINFQNITYIVGMILKIKTGASLPVYIEGSNDTEFNSTSLCYQTMSSTPLTDLEIMCRETMTVKYIRIVAASTYIELCEVQIYGGRYMSFKGNVSQTSTFQHWPLAVANRAVDGRPMLESDEQETGAMRTCAVTAISFNESWKLELSDAILLQGIYVYGRRLSANPLYISQIEGFSVHLRVSNGPLSLIYTDDHDGNYWTDYQPRVIELEAPIITNEVQIHKRPDVKDHLVLCEVEVFAECEHGKCGWDCTDVCHCSTVTTGSYNIDGRCPYGCMPRWTGQNGRCDMRCPNNTWGTNCTLNCYCLGEGKCDFNNGTCPGQCAFGWKGSSCNKPCENNMYGANCSLTCGKCMNNEQCNVTTGQCPGQCAPGYKAASCKETCDYNMYGQDCKLSCGRCRNNETCNITTGHCPGECEPGWKPGLCNEPCDNNMYGVNCRNSCGQCQNNSQCNVTNGHCSGGCAPGWIGGICLHPCENNMYGANCSLTCGKCMNNEQCNVRTGQCPEEQCAPGYKAVSCKETCDYNMYGQDCKFSCGRCQNNETCNITTGHCPGECEPGWKAGLCNESCNNNTHGANCGLTCGNCQNNEQCNITTGQCPGGCEPGWILGICTAPCDNNTYGANCGLTCGKCRDNKPCNITTGNCPLGCEPGWEPGLCNEHCNSNTFGYNCNETCGNCKINTSCNSTTGHCNEGCQAGWRGDICKQSLSLKKNYGSKDANGNPAGAIVGSLLAVITISIVSVVLFIYIRRRPASLKETICSFLPYALDDGRNYRNTKVTFQPEKEMPGSSVVQTNEITIHEVTGKSDDHVNMDKDCLANPILVSQLKSYCQTKKLDPSPLFSDFKDMPAGRQFATSKALKHSNAGKNRYRELYPYDKNVVLLPLLPGIPDSDYISASYIDGFRTRKRYIAAQGAMKTTVSDVWRMVWSHDIATIVMLTKCYELGKLKCEKYWPSEDSEKYGDIQVKLELEECFSDHVNRTFALWKTGTSEVKHTTQFHFIGWPDKDVPDDTLSLVQFWRIIKQRENADNYPWMVHCSAGIGRTGTFIAIDYLYDQGKADGSIDVKGCVRHLRDQRVNMVQTKDQYAFVHQAVKEALNPVGVSFHTEHFHDNWSALTVNTDPSGMDEMLRQYTALSDDSETSQNENEYATFNTFLANEDFKGSLKPENIGKSRRPDILPPDRYRPLLGVTEDYPDNYINAVYLSSFCTKDVIILSQLPLVNTVEDTLRLIWQCNTGCIVIMENTVPKESTYWPDSPNSVKTIGTFTVQLDSEESDSSIIKRRMKIRQKNSSDVKDIVVLHYRLWPEMLTVPENSSSILRLVSDAETILRTNGSSSRLLVQCLDGATRSGLFSVMWSILERIQSDNNVAIADTVRLARVRRKQIIPNCEQYRFCWETVKEHLESADVYGNVL